MQGESISGFMGRLMAGSKPRATTHKEGKTVTKEEEGELREHEQSDKEEFKDLGARLERIEAALKLPKWGEKPKSAKDKRDEALTRRRRS